MALSNGMKLALDWLGLALDFLGLALIDLFWVTALQSVSSFAISNHPPLRHFVQSHIEHLFLG